jgi:sulfate permease, SulP family
MCRCSLGPLRRFGGPRPDAGASQCRVGAGRWFCRLCGIPFTLTNRAAGGTGCLSGVVAGLGSLAALIGGGQVLGYVPRFVLGGLLVQLGAKFIRDWGILSRRSL